MFYNNQSNREEEDKQNLSHRGASNFSLELTDHQVYCCVQGCECSRHALNFFNHEAAVPVFSVRRCSTIQEITEPTATLTQDQLTNKFSLFIPQNNEGKNYLNFMSKSGDCVANHTRGKLKLG